MHQFGTEVDYSLSKHPEEEELLKKTVALTCQNRTSKEQSKNCSGAGSTPEGRKYVTLKGMLQGDFKFKSSVFLFSFFPFLTIFDFSPYVCISPKTIKTNQSATVLYLSLQAFL